MKPVGPEKPETKALREWFEEQEKRNLDRLETGAQTITQLVTGLYGVLFAVLAFSDKPVYMAQTNVRVLGLISMLALFGALLAALLVQYPIASGYDKDNVSAMQRLYQRMTRRKAWGLRAALLLFLLGTGLLGALIVVVLWS